MIGESEVVTTASRAVWMPMMDEQRNCTATALALQTGLFSGIFHGRDFHFAFKPELMMESETWFGDRCR